jgi:hypothetical protein
MKMERDPLSYFPQGGKDKNQKAPSHVGEGRDGGQYEIVNLKKH